MKEKIEQPLQPLLDNFREQESVGGLLLMAAAVVALIVANSPLDRYYEMLISLPVELRIGDFGIDKPLLLWINDGLMAGFFFLVGLELKRELLEGELSHKGAMTLPLAGAVGGMAVPALIFVAINWGNPAALAGWAIPAATDIAFALGILSLLGSRVPTALKVFLVSLAIFDDIGAIVIIALFYSGDLTGSALLVAALCLIVLFIMNRRNQLKIAPYVYVGLVMWVAVLKSGVHATLAGIALAMFIPLRSEKDPRRSPLKELEDDLHGAVAFFILPLFAFTNAGVSIRGLGLDAFLHPVPLGIAAGLVLGKLIGVFSACWLVVTAGLARLPQGMDWRSLTGLALLCGVGFTMSLFISSLAFQETGIDQFFDERLGILAGSLISGLAGYLMLNAVLPKAGK